MTNFNEQYDMALCLVWEIFKDKVDKGGHPYKEHAMTVKNKVLQYGTDTCICALLHDIVEDTHLTPNDLLDMGFSQEVVTTVDILTRRARETYNRYIARIVDSNNHKALVIKKADLEHNMDLGRLKTIDKKDISRVERRYIPAWKLINKTLEEYCD